MIKTPQDYTKKRIAGKKGWLFMKVKATKVMADFLRKSTGKRDFTISLEKMTERQFALCVSIETYRHTADYNPETCLFNVIKITYPPEYWAMPRYITTADLLNIFKHSNKTAEGFAKDFAEYVEI